MVKNALNNSAAFHSRLKHFRRLIFTILYACHKAFIKISRMLPFLQMGLVIASSIIGAIAVLRRRYTMQPIDVEVVTRLITEQFPEWVSLMIKPVNIVAMTIERST